MIHKELVIVNKLGLHARAAARFVNIAGRFTSSIYIERNGEQANGKSIMGVMMLAASRGTRIRLQIDGADEALAMSMLEDLIANRFGEKE